MKNQQLVHHDHKASGKKYPLCFLLNNIQLPVNIGSIFRIADALGIEKIYLTGKSITPPNTKLKKASRSTEKYVKYSYHGNAVEVTKSLKKSGYRIICLELTKDSIDIEQLVIGEQDKICLVLGAEKEGVSEELLAISGQCIHIPMHGANSSMNVANACSIAAYSIIKLLK